MASLNFLFCFHEKWRGREKETETETGRRRVRKRKKADAHASECIGSQDKLQEPLCGLRSLD